MKAAPLKTIEIVNLVDNKGRKSLSITAQWKEVAADYDDIVDEYSRARIAGFRAGKAPRDVVEKRFRREIINEFSRRCSRRLGREALSQTGAEPIGPIEITDIECGKGKPFRFIASFSPMPEIELPDLQPFKIPGDDADPRDLISNRLLEIVSFKVPDEVIRTELSSDDKDNFDRESIEWKAAADRVRLMLILKKIARQEGIEVDDADVERRIEEKAAEFGANPDMLKADFEKGGGRHRLKDMLIAESTLNFLIEESRS